MSTPLSSQPPYCSLPSSRTISATSLNARDLSWFGRRGMRQLRHRLQAGHLQRRIRVPFQSICQKKGLHFIEVSRRLSHRNLRPYIPATSKVFPDLAFTHSPLTYATFVFSRDGSLSFGTLCDMVEAGRVYKQGRVEA
jgi:hypothetical protein